MPFTWQVHPKSRSKVKLGIPPCCLALLVLATAPVVNASSATKQDETCLIQVQQEIFKSTNRAITVPNTAVAQQSEKLRFVTPDVWDFEMDAGGVDPNPPSKDGKAHPKFPSHPLWKPEWHRMIEGNSLIAGACIFLAGILCCAGGIGGGGIYVTVLMVFGQLSVHDAIPLSKVVVFAASTPSLLLNLGKTISSDEDIKTQSLINWNLIRVVVPFALIGTLLGVFLNRILPNMITLALLSTILVFILLMVCRTGYQQHCKEMLQSENEVSGIASGGTGEEVPPDTGSRAIHKEVNVEEKGVDKQIDGDANVVSNREVAMFFSMLVVIIYCGTMHYHAVSCADDESAGLIACHHPIALTVTFGQMLGLKSSGCLYMLGKLALLMAIMYCLAIGAFATHGILKRGEVYGSLHKFDSIGNTYAGAIMSLYIVMSVTTGALAGLVGIGGGLIFSPFFIEMRIDPHIAVATSATCVIFTSSSTTFQYLFSDRIIVSLIISFCVPHLLAAYTGTKLVHYIQEHYANRKSWVTWIVALGVGISCFLAIQKMFIRGHASE